MNTLKKMHVTYPPADICYLNEVQPLHQRGETKTKAIQTPERVGN